MCDLAIPHRALFIEMLSIDTANLSLLEDVVNKGNHTYKWVKVCLLQKRVKNIGLYT
jgi:hypothetical protein